MTFGLILIGITIASAVITIIWMHMSYEKRIKTLNEIEERVVSNYNLLKAKHENLIQEQSITVKKCRELESKLYNMNPPKIGIDADVSIQILKNVSDKIYEASAELMGYKVSVDPSMIGNKVKMTVGDKTVIVFVTLDDDDKDVINIRNYEPDYSEETIKERPKAPESQPKGDV